MSDMFSLKNDLMLQNYSLKMFLHLLYSLEHTAQQCMVSCPRWHIVNCVPIESRFKEKHSLDSDEEDNEQISGKLDDEEIEGQEESTVDYDDGIKVTPFNLKEEMEDGWVHAVGLSTFVALFD